VASGERDNRTGQWLIAALALLLALLANASNFFLAGVLTGPVALLVAAYPLWRGRGWTRALALVAALLAVAAFAISLAVIYGLSHDPCGDGPC
jgi:uncharacterized membrane protein (UPF0136 family)